MFVMAKIRNGMEGVIQICNIGSRAIIAALLAETIFVGAWQVLARFVFHSSLSWSEELLRFSFVWVTFLGSAVGLSQGSHMNVQAFTNMMPKKVGWFLRLLGRGVLVWLCFFCVGIPFSLPTMRF